MFIPLSIKAAIPSLLQEAGPIVQTILVRRSLVVIGFITMSCVMKPPAKSGISDVLEIILVNVTVEC